MFKKIAVPLLLTVLAGALAFGLAGCSAARGQGAVNQAQSLLNQGQGQSQGQGQGQGQSLLDQAQSLLGQAQAGSAAYNASAQSGGNSLTSVPGSGQFTAAQGRGRGRGPGGSGGSGAGGSGGGGYGAGGGQANLPPASGTLSADEQAALVYMREEEKLAHDVYVTLYAKWGLPVFQNISGSEQSHTEAVKMLLDRYGVADPASPNVGVFTDPTLQKLYNDLTAQGSQSAAEALKVGAAIEEIDILDLEKRLAQTDKPDIQQVFNNLMRGSYNHLRAFVMNLQTQTGETYQPQYLSADAYQAILAGSAGGYGSGRGQGGGGGRGMGGGGRP